MEPVFSADGMQIYYRRGDALDAVSFERTPEGVRLGRPSRLFEGGFASYNNARVFDPRPDGSGFIAVERTSERAPFTVIVGLDELIARQSTRAAR